MLSASTGFTLFGVLFTTIIVAIVVGTVVFVVKHAYLVIGACLVKSICKAFSTKKFSRSKKNKRP